MQSRFRRIGWRVGLGLAALYLLLLIPDPTSRPPKGAGKKPFVWNRDAIWSQQEQQFLEARAAGCESLAPRVKAPLAETQDLLAKLATTNLPPDAKEFDLLETRVFELAPFVAVCPEKLTNYIALAEEARAVTKRQSEHWDLTTATARERLYRTLSGVRAALEEVMLQAPTNLTIPNLTFASANSAVTPAMQSHGVTLHSGDVLVSRGGAPTSALIARANDFPGSFSHVALLHVDPASGEGLVIESHIECGVTISPLERYLQDKKLRIMVLRLREDLPAVKSDPMLAHKAAEAGLANARGQHIPYDFAMDLSDPRKQFCSEVASTAYTTQGIRLWLEPSYISSPVVTAWLSSMGVKFFETQEPADLEHDPQLQVVAEWRDQRELFKAHVDDATTDVMLEAGQPGKGLPYPMWLLPLARITKAYSVVLNWCGKIGPIPEGMNATEALRADKYGRDHAAIVNRLLAASDQFKKDKGYTPPYWELLRLGREARLQELR